MKQALSALLIVGTALVTGSPLRAETILCPDITQARQVGECPGEAEIKRMFDATCGFERDPNAANPEKCDSYAEFKRRKNTALWESDDGRFVSYASCAVDPAQLRSGKLREVTVSQKNGLYKVACHYTGGTSFTMRTRSVCRIPGIKTSLIMLRKQCDDGAAASCSVVCD